MTKHLNDLENQSVYIIREAYSATRSMAVLWSMGKDSTVLMHLVRKAFMGHFPIPLLHIDTSYKIPEMIAWRDALVRKNNLRLIVGQNHQSLADGMGPEKGRLICCSALKTQALIDIVKQHGLQALLLGIRKDEEGSRGKERVVSPRSTDEGWQYKNQPAEMWGYYNLHVPSDVHLRIHPILHWTELDVWEYIARENLEVMPLYFANNGKRYRSLGCATCTNTIRSRAHTVNEIIDELKVIPTSERAGRAQDLEHAYAMQHLRTTGYM